MDRIVLGAMSGTSLDGIDAAAVAIDGHGLSMRARFLGAASTPFPAALADSLRRAHRQHPMPSGDFARLARELALAHLAPLTALAGKHGPITLAAIHGQTIFHSPPFSWQLLDPFPIAHALSCPVVANLRGADLAAGGQGAPITPLSDFILFRGPEVRAILNLGGFANATILPAVPDGSSEEELRLAATAIRGFDICICNQMLDELARRHLGQPFDRDGAVAASGTPDPARVAALRSRLHAQLAQARSLGTMDEGLDGLDASAGTSAPSILASAVEAVAQTIASALGRHRPGRLLIAGGGARNRALTAAIQRAAGLPAEPIETQGMPVEAREAACMAVLGALAADGVPITLAAVTGAATASPAAAGVTAAATTPAASGAWCGNLHRIFTAPHTPCRTASQ